MKSTIFILSLCLISGCYSNTKTYKFDSYGGVSSFEEIQKMINRVHKLEDKCVEYYSVFVHFPELKYSGNTFIDIQNEAYRLSDTLSEYYSIYINLLLDHLELLEQREERLLHYDGKKVAPQNTDFNPSQN